MPPEGTEFDRPAAVDEEGDPSTGRTGDDRPRTVDSGDRPAIDPDDPLVRALLEELESGAVPDGDRTELGRKLRPEPHPTIEVWFRYLQSRLESLAERLDELESRQERGEWTTTGERRGNERAMERRDDANAGEQATDAADDRGAPSARPADRTRNAGTDLVRRIDRLERRQHRIQRRLLGEDP